MCCVKCVNLVIFQGSCEMSDLLHLLFYRLFTSPLKDYQVYTLLHNTSMQLNVILTPLCELLRYELVLRAKMAHLYV